MMAPRCDACPCPAENRCLATSHSETFGHFCRLAATGARKYLQLVAGRSAFGYDPPRPVATEGANASPSAAASIRQVAAMKACPSWVARSDCGCGVNECLEGKGRGGLVGHQDCFACLDGRDPVSIATGGLAGESLDDQGS